MNRPSKTGLLVLLAFSVPVIVEFRTVLSMVGVELPLSTYLGIASVFVVLALVGIWLLPEKESPEEDTSGNSNVRPSD